MRYTPHTVADFFSALTTESLSLGKTSTMLLRPFSRALYIILTLTNVYYSLVFSWRCIKLID